MNLILLDYIEFVSMATKVPPLRYFKSTIIQNQDSHVYEQHIIMIFMKFKVYDLCKLVYHCKSLFTNRMIIVTA